MKSEKKIQLLVIGALVALILVLLLAGIYRKSHPQKEDPQQLTEQPKETESSALDAIPVEEEQTIDVTVVEERIRSLGLLVTQEYDFKDVIDYSEAKTLLGWTLPGTTSRFLASYEGNVQAGIDFEEVEVRKDDDSRTVTVVLPAAEILNVTIDNDSLEVYEEIDGWGTDISVEDFNSSQTELKEKARESAIEKGLLTKADQNAQTIVGNLVSSLVDEAAYSISIEKK